MDLIIISLFYFLITACIIYPPTEFVTAGFTIPQLFDVVLGSENHNFVTYHMRRTSITMVIHSLLPAGYWFSLYFGGWRSEWELSTLFVTWLCVVLVLYKMFCWWKKMMVGHPVVKTLLPYVTEGMDWREVAGTLNSEFFYVDKVSIQLGNTSKVVATQNWLIKVTQYRVDLVKQADCTLVATATDSHNLSVAGDDEIQFVNIEVVPTRDDIKPFSFRISTTALRDLQSKLSNPIRVPPHLFLQPTLIEKFVIAFKDVVMKNPEYVVPDTEEREQCIGCMQEQADVKIQRRCLPPPPHLIDGPPECQTCNCRVLWCITCLARWWAARSNGLHPSQWLSGRCTCPVCRANFCLLDVRPVKPPSPAPPISAA